MFDNTEIDPVEAEKRVRDCLCSDCYGDLTAVYNRQTRLSRVTCSTEGCPNHGVVSKRFVEKREAKSKSELLNATTALTMAGVLPKQSASQILAELGF
jgi:nicotinamide mononucleotide (NMN) deamidase PncC